MRGNFNSGKQFSRVWNEGLAAGSANAQGATFDCQNFRSVSAVVHMGAIAATAVTALKWQHSDASGSGWTDVEGSKVTVADDDDNQVVIMSYERVDKRYVRLAVERATANAAIRSATYIACLARDSLIAQPAGIHSVNQVEG